VPHFSDFETAIRYSTDLLLTSGRDVDTGSWQGYETKGKPDLITKEILNLQLDVPVDRSLWVADRGSHLVGVRDVSLSYPDELTPRLMREIKPNLPWADAHFEERVSRNPSNPGEEYKNWPWWQGQYHATASLADRTKFVFDHTYQERFWARYDEEGITRRGIRYRYGDLDDVVKLLETHPYTRQATFPIFFPEDTGASFGGRIPCTLHYHFLLRDNQLHMWYPIRSCDLVRHFRDDLYLACRLMLWVLEELREDELRSDSPQLWVDARPGTLYFTAYSFHAHQGDLHHVT
jgi:hypothetical protein